MLRTIIFLFLLPVLSNAQWLPITAVEVNGGINNHRYFDIVPEAHEYRSDYNYGTGYSFRIGLRYKSLIFKLPSRVTLGIDHVSGYFDIFDYRTLKAEEASGEISRTLITLEGYPVNLTLWKGLGFNFGVHFSQLLWEKAEGKYTNYIGEEVYGYLPLKEVNDPFSAEFNAGFISRLEYQIDLGDQLFLYPHYAYLVNFLSAFEENFNSTFSMRHYFGLGIMRKFKQ